MKKIINKMILALILMLGMQFAYSQSGLEGIIVEKYYVASAADNAAVSTLPVGAVTYRVYADLASGWGLQALYGDPTNNHFLKVTSTQNFLNFSGGSFTGIGLDNTAFGTGALALDSYFTIGASSDATEGVLKTEDDGALNLLTGNSILNNVTPAMGIGLKTQDGNVAGSPDAPTIVGLTTAQQNIFKTGILGNSLNDNDCAISSGSPNGQTVGPTATNRILIGQFTTAGELGFELNLQIRNTTTFAVEKWVANNPQGGEFTMASLTRVPNTPPTCVLDQPAANANVITGTAIALAATATDAAPGNVVRVEFVLDGSTVIATDFTAPYTGSWNSIAGCHVITARAIDNDSATTTSTQAIQICSGANQPPTITISAASNAIVGDAVAISSTVGDVDGTVTQVEFFVDNVSIGIDNSGPVFSMNWNAVLGNHSIKAIATDNIGATTTSNILSISVAANTPPTASITSPANGASFTHPVNVIINASANDSDGSITNVEFLVNNVVVGSDNTFPYSFSWSSVIGSANLTVRATDNKGAQTTSSIVHIDILDPNALPYKVNTVLQNCLASTFNVPVAAVDAVDNIIGYDVVVSYDKNKVTPTGIVTVRSNLVDSLLVETVNSIDYTNGKINVSAFFNSSAPANSKFMGAGTIFEVEFYKLPAFQNVDTAAFCITSLQESRITGVSQKLGDCGKYISYKDSLFTASLRFWADNNPIVYNAAQPNNYLATNIFGNNGACNAPSATSVQPNINGSFTYNILNGLYVDIRRDILPTTSVQPMVNGYDALLVRKLLVNDPAFIPNIYQMIAMDVNMDGVISAGDLSQINQRAVLMIPEFKQAWNYNASGVSNGQPSKDWIFVDASRVTGSLAYKISSTFPLDNGVGYSKYRVPVVPFCLPVTVSNPTDCPLISPEIYRGVGLGDVNGNYQNLSPDGFLRSNDKVIFDLSNAVIKNHIIEIPVTFNSSKPVNAIDFALQLNGSNLNYIGMVNTLVGLQSLDHLSKDDEMLRFTSNSLEVYPGGEAVSYIRCNTLNDQITAEDLKQLTALINGEEVNVEIRTQKVNADKAHDMNAYVYPNPNSGSVHVYVDKDATMQLFAMNGDQLMMDVRLKANEAREFNLNELSNGVYLVKISNDKQVETRKLVINK